MGIDFIFNEEYTNFLAYNWIASCSFFGREREHSENKVCLVRSRRRYPSDITIVINIIVKVVVD
jgi:hypothetical protein